jgi:hypothetical protein
MDNINSKSEMVAHWLPIVAALTIMDPNQPKPLMQLPICIEQDSMKYHTTVLIDLATTLNFVGQDFLTRNNRLSKCIRGPKIVVRIASEQRISTATSFPTTNISLGQKKLIGLSFTGLPHLKCVDFIFGLLAMKELNMLIQSSKDMVLIGDMTFYASHNHVRFRAF